MSKTVTRTFLQQMIFVPGFLTPGQREVILAILGSSPEFGTVEGVSVRTLKKCCHNIILKIGDAAEIADIKFGIEKLNLFSSPEPEQFKFTLRALEGYVNHREAKGDG
jgi:hypothetical protein